MGILDTLMVELGMGPFLLLAGVLIVLYVFYALGLSGLAKDRMLTGMGWLAWIPLANLFLLGRIADDICYCTGRRRHYRVLLPVFGVLDVLFFGTYLMLVLALIGLVLNLFCLYEIYSDYAAESRVVFLVLSVLLPITPILLFCLRKREGESLKNPPGTWENGVFYRKGKNPPVKEETAG